MGFVDDGYDSAPAPYRAMAGDFLDLQALDGHGNVVLGYVVGGGFVGVVVKTASALREGIAGGRSCRVG